MSASSDLHNAVKELLEMTSLPRIDSGAVVTAPALRVPVKVIARREKDLENEIEAAAANKGLCVYVLPPLPTSAQRNVPFVFFDRAEVRVRIIERPPINRTGADAYDLIDDVATALQWQPNNALPAAVQKTMEEESVDRVTAMAMVRANPIYAPLVALNDILAHPLELADRPVEAAEDPAQRIYDVIFHAVYQLNRTATA